LRFFKDNVVNILQIIILFTLISVFLFIGSMIKKEISDFTDDKSAEYVQMLSENYKMDISYSKISAQFLHRLIISDVNILLKDNFSFHIDSLVLKYKFSSLVKSFLFKKGEPVINKFYVNNYSVIFMSSENSDSLEFEIIDFIPIFNLLPDLKLTNGDIKIKTKPVNIIGDVKKIKFDKSRRSLSIDSLGKILFNYNGNKSFRELSYNITCNTQINSNWNGLRGSLVFLKADSLLSLNNKVGVLFILENNLLKFAKKKDRFKVDLQGEIDLNTFQGSGSIISSRFSVTDIITFDKDIYLPEFITKSTLSGNFVFNWDKDFHPKYSGNIRLYVPDKLILPGRISLSLNFEGDREKVDIFYGKVTWKENKAILRGAYHIDTGKYYFDIYDLVYKINENYLISTAGFVKGDLNSGSVKTRKLFVNSYDVGTMQLSANYSSSLVYSEFVINRDLSISDYLNGSLTYNVVTGQLRSVLDINKYKLSDSFELMKSESLPKAVKPFGNYFLGADIFISMNTTDFESLQIDANNVTLSDYDLKLPIVRFESHYVNKSLYLKDIKIAKDKEEISGEIDISFIDLQNLDFNAGILYNNVNYNFQGLVHDKIILLKEQKYLNCMIIAENNSVDFTINLTDFPIPEFLKTNNFFPEIISLNTSVKYLKDKFPVFGATELIIVSHLPYLGQTEFQTNLKIDEKSIIMNYFQAKTENLGVYNGQGAADLDYKTDFNFWAEVKGEEDQNYRLAFEKSSDFSDMYLFAQKIPLSLLKKNFLEGSLDADIKGQKLNDNWNFTGLLNSENFIFKGQEYDVNGNLTANKKLVELNNLNFIGEKIDIIDINLKYLIESKKLLGKTNDIKLKNFKIETGAEWDILFDKGYIFGNVIVDSVFMRDQLFINKKVFSMEKKDEIFRGVINKGEDLLVNYNQKSKKLDLSINGAMPLKVDISGSVKDGYINYSVKNINVDASIASYFIPMQIKDHGRIFTVDEGLLTGKCTIQGQSLDPEIYGTLNISDLSTSSPLILEELKIDNAKVILQGRRISFLPATWLTREKDNGIIEGSLDLENGSPASYSFHLSVSGKKGLAVKVPFSGLVLDGFIQTDITFSGSKESGLLSGHIDIIDSEIYLGESMVFESNKNSQSFELQTDLNLFVNKRVFTYIPNKTIPVIKASLKNGNSLKIKQNSLSGVFNLDGSISLDKGDINYFGRIFSIEEGSIQFNEDQINFNPRIYVRAVINEKDDLGEVEISLIYNDRLMNDFSPVFTSNPARTNEQIMAIMGDTFNSPLNSDAGTLASLIGTGSSYATQLVLATPIEEGLRKWLNMDYVSLRTSLIENIVVLSQSDTETTLSQYLDNTSLSLGKSLTDDIQFSSELGITYNDISYTENNFNGFEFNTEFSLEFTTPLFDLIWSIAPDSPEDLFVSDNTITIIKKFTY